MTTRDEYDAKYARQAIRVFGNMPSARRTIPRATPEPTHPKCSLHECGNPVRTIGRKYCSPRCRQRNAYLRSRTFDTAAKRAAAERMRLYNERVKQWRAVDAEYDAEVRARRTASARKWRSTESGKESIRRTRAKQRAKRQTDPSARAKYQQRLTKQRASARSAHKERVDRCVSEAVAHIKERGLIIDQTSDARLRDYLSMWNIRPPSPEARRMGRQTLARIRSELRGWMPETPPLEITAVRPAGHEDCTETHVMTSQRGRFRERRTWASHYDCWDRLLFEHPLP